MNIPQGIRAGDTIGVIAPAAAMPAGDIELAIRTIRSMGFEVEVSPHAIRDDSYFGAGPDERARDLEAMFCDPSIAGIMCVKGGYGSMEILDHLDYERLAEHPKVFMGYSDITALLIAISKRSDMITFHGPMLYSFVSKADEFTLSSLQSVLTGSALAITSFEPPEGPVVLRTGAAEGTLVGGNLTLLSHLVGTEYDFETADCILFLEDVDEDLYRIERSLLHLKLAGKLSRITALIMGEMVNVRTGKVPLGKDLAQIVLGVCGDMTYPIVMDFPCGHGARQMTLPLGIRSRIVAKRQLIEFGLLENPVLL
ncbi:MAG: LD-carboxypeptidase [Actinomycetota bacterium]|nr:LD-carboxypeptidase [Actinomycetota bacterium]